MNNQLSGLDPKLAEKYHQVMNTPIPPAPTQPIQPIQPTFAPTPITPAPIEPKTIPAAPVYAKSEAQQSEDAMPQPIFANMPEQQPQVQQASTPAVRVAEPINVSNSQVFKVQKKAGKISPVIIILATVVFLLVYTLVWTKIFNLKLPFLP